MTLSSISDADEAEIESYQRALIEPAAMLFGLQKLYGDKVCKQTRAAYGRMNDAHMLIMGVLSAALHRTHGKIVPITPTSEERESLFAGFVIGIPLCERAIEEGRYIQALILIRQEMEILAQLISIRTGQKKKNAPRILQLSKNQLDACMMNFLAPRMYRIMTSLEPAPK